MTPFTFFNERNFVETLVTTSIMSIHLIHNDHR